MLTDKEKTLIDKFYRKKRKAEMIYLLQRFLCFFNFHAPYYKYGQTRNITYNTNPPSYSNGPEHLGYHCRICELPLGKFRESKYWFRIVWPR